MYKSATPPHLLLSRLLSLLACAALFTCASPQRAAAEGAGCNVTCEAMCEEGGDLYDPSDDFNTCMRGCVAGCAPDDDNDLDEDSEENNGIHGESGEDAKKRCKKQAEVCKKECKGDSDPSCYEQCMLAEVCDF